MLADPHAFAARERYAAVAHAHEGEEIAAIMPEFGFSPELVSTLVYLGGGYTIPWHAYVEGFLQGAIAARMELGE